MFRHEGLTTSGVAPKLGTNSTCLMFDWQPRFSSDLTGGVSSGRPPVQGENFEAGVTGHAPAVKLVRPLVVNCKGCGPQKKPSV